MKEKSFFSTEDEKGKYPVSPKILEEYKGTSRNLLKKFRFSAVDGADRQEQGQKFVIDLSTELFNNELNRRQILENNDPEQREKQTEEVRQELVEGMILASNIGPKEPAHNDGGRKKWKKAMVADYYGKEYPDGGEVRLKGYLLSTMLDCAHWSNKSSALTQIIELWADNHYEDKNGKADKIKEILADIMPLLNKVKAYACADAAHQEGERATNIFFSPRIQDKCLYYNDTFRDSGNSEFKEDGKTRREYPNVGIKQALEKYGFSGAEADGAPIVDDKINEAEKEDIKKKFLFDLKQAQDIVNKERVRREEKRLRRIGGLAVEMRSAERTVKQEEDGRKARGEKKSANPFGASDAEIAAKRLKNEAEDLEADKKVQWSEINLLPEKHV